MRTKIEVSTLKVDIINLRKNNPKYTLQRIGNETCVSREYVRQILKKNHLPTKHTLPLRICPICGLDGVKYGLKYHKECYHNAHTKILQCSSCGKQFERNLADAHRNLKYPNKGKIVFCSKECHGRYLGTHHSKRS